MTAPRWSSSIRYRVLGVVVVCDMHPWTLLLNWYGVERYDRQL